MRILLIEDDPSLGHSLQSWLQLDGYAVDWLQRGDQAAAALDTHDYQCVLLDRGLPGLDGDAVLQRLRARGADGARLPVILITARDTLADRVQGLDLGADDYLVKPFDLEELSARVRAALRRGATEADAPDTIDVDGLVLDFAAHLASRDGRPIHLTPTEWRILAELARHPGRVVSHEGLLRSVWGPGYGREHHYLRVYANQIRRKIEADPSHPRHLINEPGLGYRLRS